MVTLDLAESENIRCEGVRRVWKGKAHLEDRKRSGNDAVNNALERKRIEK